MTATIRAVRKTDEVAARLSDASGRLRLLSVLNPENLTEQRSLFLAGWQRGTKTNPVFVYAEPDERLRKAERDLAVLVDEIPRGRGIWYDVIKDEAEQALAKAAAYTSHVASRITDASAAEYGLPDTELVSRAEKLLAGHAAATRHDDEPSVTDQQAAAVLRATLDHADLGAWTVSVTPRITARMSVRVSDRLVQVKAGTSFVRSSLEALMVHEIGTHVFRYVNCAQGPRLFGFPRSGNTVTDEGLAVWHELRCARDQSVLPDRRLGLRVLAVHTAVSGSFADVVEALLPWATPEEAFDVAVRVKRGLRDTGEPGGFMKDHAYLAGLGLLSEHLRGTPEDYPALMSAKWPLHHVGLVRAAIEDSLLPARPRLPDAEFVQFARAAVDEACRG